MALIPFVYESFPFIYSQQAEEASEKDDGGANDFRLESNSMQASGTAATRAGERLLPNSHGEDDIIINEDAYQYSPGSNIPLETPDLVDLAPTTTHSVSRTLEDSGQGSVSSSSTSVSTSTSTSSSSLSTKIGASYEEARRIFELGIVADPAHGPLYNAYGWATAGDSGRFYLSWNLKYVCIIN